MIIQDLNLARTIIASQLKSRPNIRSTTIFSCLREKSIFCFIGDYSIIFQTAAVFTNQQQKISPKEIARIFKQSPELKKYGRASSVLVKSLCLDI